ncbi:hypothetical protein Hamer_G014526 [Homarus americanus]|uniref:Uncharacterized protein n=1 Tax=Homarus americanus TaxID=6706 RepID=A0A8J5N4M6_HOMAM|nr:hypothetical protein Hamer_G014526 [Homarus americanus]
MEVVEGQKVTISAIRPVIQGLKHSLEHLLTSGSSSNSQLQYCEPLARGLLDSVKKRLDPCIEMRDVRTAAFLDPWFKMDWLSSQEQKDQVLIDIKEMLEELEAVQEGSTEEENDKNDLAEGLPESKRPRPFSFVPPFPTRPQNQRASEGSTVSLFLKQL